MAITSQSEELQWFCTALKRLHALIVGLYTHRNSLSFQQHHWYVFCCSTFLTSLCTFSLFVYIFESILCSLNWLMLNFVVSSILMFLLRSLKNNKKLGFTIFQFVWASNMFDKYDSKVITIWVSKNKSIIFSWH